ncbi:cytochrome b [Aliidiomarina indica]|uniref:cytochrome b n=1 Tax=Aliidiomarina indica TaxID=2749147 RepID=UPI00188FD67A|nr:cytochrome b [Aliidiomarina indica]
MSTRSYHVAARVLHWSMALLILSMLFAGLAMVQSLEPWHLTLLQLHKSFGVVALVAVLARVIIRARFTPPPLPNSVPPLQKKVAKLSHILLYAAMFAMPISGWLMQNAAGRPVVVFDMFALPSLLPQNLALYGFLREFHGWVAWAFIALILVHIGAALHHGLIKRDGVLQQMLGNKPKD